MCGVGGCVVSMGEQPSRERLVQLEAALEHRGPDDRGVLILDSVGLANTRLAIMDPTSRGRQPVVSADRRWALVYNGEVFNHLDLRGQLRSQPFNSACDTETVLRSIQQWGVPGSLSKMNGFFALAALDIPNRRLVLARDRFGVKPLYWGRHEGAFWFASEIRALLASGFPRVIDRDRLARALTYGWANGEQTLIKGIRAVMPGTTLTIDLGTLGCSVERWYDPADAVNPDWQAELASRSRAELKDLFEQEIRAAVGRRLQADVPVGAMCSGGVDSSLVTALARESSPAIRGFTASISDVDAPDEAQHAARVADRLGIELETISVTAESWRNELVDAVSHFEYPLPNESPAVIAALAAAARRQGVKVLLAGEGADELFGGYWRPHREAYLEYLSAWPRLHYAAESVRRMGPGGTLLALARRAGVPGPHRAPPFDFGGEGGFEEEVEERAAHAYAHHGAARRRLERELLTSLSQSLPPLLNRMDKNTMQHGVEVRLPFLDPGLAALVINLPLEARVTPRPKGVLRDVAARHLPGSVLRRPKQPGMIFDARPWITQGARPRFLTAGVLRESLEVPVPAWEEVVASARGRQATSLWTGEMWCRLMIEARDADEVKADIWPGKDSRAVGVTSIGGR